MQLNIRAELDYSLSVPSDILLQVRVADMAAQNVTSQSLDIGGEVEAHPVEGEDGIGSRLWLHCEDRLTATYEARVAIDRPVGDCTRLEQHPVHELPSETVKYLMGSRYCDVAAFHGFVKAEFGGITGGERIIAMRDWIERKFRYRPGVSNASTTAVDTFVARQGICRDYAHVMIALARACAVPARIASVYALGVKPQDFHAVAEVYLDGDWHLVDPTGMAQMDGMAVIGVGRDAADVSFLTIYGAATLNAQQVDVQKA